MAFVPNNRGKLFRQNGKNVFNEVQWLPGRTVLCGVVELNDAAVKTSVRTDSSASRANAEETTATAKILFPGNVTITKQDRFEIAGITLRATKIQPRWSVAGILDHYEVDLMSWVGEK